MREIHPPLALPGDAATSTLGARLAPLLCAGDTLLLEGDLGAGKTHLARAIIQSLLGPTEEVPSPSFTLVQIYEAPEFEIWHADLYRLSGPAGVEELGLYDAMETALCLIEWPDRLGPPPPSALVIRLFHQGEGRRAEFHSADPAWAQRLADV